MDEPFDYELYSDSMEKIRVSIEAEFPDGIEHLKKCDHLILSTLAKSDPSDSLTAAIHSHSLYLAACKLALGGHFSSIFPILRTAMESAIYGYLFNKEPGLSEVWRKRHLSKTGFNRSAKKFRDAISRFRTYLQEHDKSSGDTPYENHVMDLYDAAIDFGAHPNPIALTNSESISIKNDLLIYQYDYLSSNKKKWLQGLFACYDYGIAISIVNHFSHMQINNNLAGLDATFLSFIQETNDISDWLNEEPIDHDTRNYQRENNFVNNSRKVANKHKTQLNVRPTENNKRI